MKKTILIIIGIIPILIWLSIDFLGTIVDLFYAFIIFCVICFLISPLLVFIGYKLENEEIVRFNKSKKYLSNKYCNIGVAQDLSCIKIFERNKNPRRIITIYTYKSEAPKLWNTLYKIHNDNSTIDFWKNFCNHQNIHIKETIEEKT